jgi:hypothetical protein
MRSYLVGALLVLAACGPVDGSSLGAGSSDDTACNPLGATVSGVAFTDSQATAVIDMIDHATAAELDAVPAIGPTLANAIIASRPFASNQHPLSKLDAISGIGVTVLTALRDNADAVWCDLDDGRQSCCGAGAAPGPSVVINEFSAGSNGWVELYNVSSSPIDLSGWVVDDIRSGGAKAAGLAAGTTIQPSGFVVVPFGGINVASSDQVNLVDANGHAVDETANFYAGSSISGKCFGRTPDGGGWGSAAVPCTEGASNGGPSLCAAHGGTYDGTTFTAAEECHANDFLNQARFSEMAAIPDSPRHIAYDCQSAATAGSPHAISCGSYRTGVWSGLAQYSGVAGVGSSALSGLKSAAAGWQKNGLSYDTVANTWQNRQALLQKPVSLDAVYVTKRIADENVAGFNYACVEVRDAPSGANYLAACEQIISADSAPACANVACVNDMVGKWLRLRGTVRTSSVQPGGYKINLSTSIIPPPADPRFMPGGSGGSGGSGGGLDCDAIVTAAGEQCGGFSYNNSECLVAYLDSHNAQDCMAELQSRMFDDT